MSNLMFNVDSINIEKPKITKSHIKCKPISKLERFRQLRAKSNNKIKLIMDIATNTNEMVDDGIF